jgi:division protein CdvB (Snf7/Vps24/ESCRT-III family)
VAQRLEFEQDVAQLLQDFEAEIDTLEAQVIQADAATQAELNEEIAQLRQQREQLQQQAAQLQAATAEEWQQLKMELLTGIENLDRSFEEAESRVG